MCSLSKLTASVHLCDVLWSFNILTIVLSRLSGSDPSAISITSCIAVQHFPVAMRYLLKANPVCFPIPRFTSPYQVEQWVPDASNLPTLSWDEKTADRWPSFTKRSSCGSAPSRDTVDHCAVPVPQHPALNQGGNQVQACIYLQPALPFPQRVEVQDCPSPLVRGCHIPTAQANAELAARVSVHLTRLN